MSSFTRFAGVAVVLLSLGFLVTALPAVRDVKIPAVTGSDPVSLICAKIFVDLEVCIRALLGCGTIAELTVAVHAVVAVVDACVADLLKVGAHVAVDVEAKASIVACVAATITLLVQVCLQVSVKFGFAVVATLFAEIDVCLRALLVNLNICIDGILVLIVKALGSLTVDLLVKLHLKLCVGILGIQL